MFVCRTCAVGAACWSNAFLQPSRTLHVRHTLRHFATAVRAARARDALPVHGGVWNVALEHAVLAHRELGTAPAAKHRERPRPAVEAHGVLVYPAVAQYLTFPLAC